MQTEDDDEFNLLADITIPDPAMTMTDDELGDDMIVDLGIMEQEMGDVTRDDAWSVPYTVSHVDAEEATHVLFAPTGAIASGAAANADIESIATEIVDETGIEPDTEVRIEPETATKTEVDDNATETAIDDPATETEIEQINANSDEAVDSLVVDRPGSAVGNPWVILGGADDTYEADETLYVSDTDSDCLSPAKQAAVASAWAVASRARSDARALASKTRAKAKAKANAARISANRWRH